MALKPTTRTLLKFRSDFPKNTPEGRKQRKRELSVIRSSKKEIGSAYGKNRLRTFQNIASWQAAGRG